MLDLIWSVCGTVLFVVSCYTTGWTTTPKSDGWGGWVSGSDETLFRVHETSFSTRSLPRSTRREKSFEFDR